ncbi:MAG TPA: ribosomal protein S18-alanine N-acetyltransferase [Candidatus Acidoferrales bacterium]|nr:ribosomal protein S18-alanine N-acetyltransferase [Candidatus Acidoferrales bacterium]
MIRVFNGVEDAAAVSEILREAREAASWSEEALRETVKLPGVTAYVSERNGAISGIVVGRQVLDEAEVLNLAVMQGMRRQGEGRALVRQLLNRFAELAVSRVFLEVRESNAGAITFYRGLGFEAIGTRRDYYQDPKESATVMELWLRKFTV